MLVSSKTEKIFDLQSDQDFVLNFASIDKSRNVKLNKFESCPFIKNIKDRKIWAKNPPIGCNKYISRNNLAINNSIFMTSTSTKSFDGLYQNEDTVLDFINSIITELNQVLSEIIHKQDENLKSVQYSFSSIHKLD